MHTPLTLAAAWFAAFLSPTVPTTNPAPTDIRLSSDESKAISAFKKAFRGSKKRPRSVRQRGDALALLDGHDSDKIAAVLAASYLTVHLEVADLDARRIEANKELAELLAGQEFSRRRILPNKEQQRYFELRQQSNQLRLQVDSARELQVALRNRIGALRSAAACKWLVSSVVGAKKYPLPLKIAAARAAGTTDAELLPDLQRALKRSRRPGELIAILDALGLIGKAAEPVAADVIKLLRHKEEAVRERAALALSKIAVPAAITPMIELLARERGMAQERVAAALEILTGQQHGIVVGAWRAWLEAEGAPLLAGRQPLGEGEPSVRKRTAKNYYMGIPQDGKAIVYIIDASGSMKQIVNWQTPSETTSAGGGRREMSRLEACKGELIQALGRLEHGKKFNVVWYSDLPYLHNKTMLVADAQTIKAAQDWVRQLQPTASTNIHDALQMAFGLIGRGKHDKYYGIEIDTVFLLTDGSPTKPDGSLDSTKKIISTLR